MHKSINFNLLEILMMICNCGWRWPVMSHLTNLFIRVFASLDEYGKVDNWSKCPVCNTVLFDLFLSAFSGVSFNSVYTQIWRVLLHLAADPFPEVSDLAMKVLNSIAYKVCRLEVLSFLGPVCAAILCLMELYPLQTKTSQTSLLDHM